MHCPSCSSQIPVGSRFCPSCGVSLEVVSSDPTRTRTPISTAHARFATGDVLAGRYRIVDRIGEGGMGEVYRADDLTLEQSVALKFLPQGLASSPERLKQFRREVRIARQIAHPNVCRVYDIGEADGLVFLTMEYIHGEDLGSLLRRIGRLPPDKAIQIARQLASGLAAAHDRGVLHRDLKPANVMLDERGQARVTDFGLAAAAGAIDKRDIRSGTPAYMAPEQWGGEEVTERSDLYSLGLVLYELFTGKRAFGGETPQELAARRDMTPENPASLVEGLDPSVGRVILKCLHFQAGERPESALAVRALLPGGDPLASALAAGETPAPELVAEAGEGGALRPAIAWACLGGVLLSLPLILWMSSLSRLTEIVPLPRPPAFLAADAREMLASFGYPDPPRDTTYGFSRHVAYIDQLMEEERSDGWLDLLRRGEPSVVRFWYRESPDYLVPHRVTEIVATAHDPPLTVPDMIDVQLDPNGRLRRLDVVPPELDEAGDGPATMDWHALLEAAGLDPQRMTETDPLWFPSGYATERAAFTGVFPDAPEIAIRVEAGALLGRPIWFRVIEPWTQPAETAPSFFGPSDSLTSSVGKLTHIGLNLFLIVVLALLARRNLRLGRGDRKNAFRLAFVLFVLHIVRWLFGAHHVPASAEAEIVFGGLYRAFYTLGLVWLFYIAFEPYARRLWPKTMVSWVRLLNGRFHDARVGRDILLGCVLGISIRLWSLLWLSLLPGWFGDVPPRPDLPLHASELLSLQGIDISLSQLFAHAGNAVNTSLFSIFGFLLLRFLLRSTWAAVLGGTGIMAFLRSSAHPYMGWTSFFVWAVWFLFFLRFGWVTVVVAIFVTDVLQSYPLTVDLSAWYAHPTYLALAVVVALTLYGFKVSLGGRPAFGDLLGES